MAGRVDGALLSAVLRRISNDEQAIVFSAPWDWPGVKTAPALRRVFDMTDDWSALMPGRESRFAAYYSDIAEHADAIIVVNPRLGRHFGGREVTVVRNGVHAQHVAAVYTAPDPKTMIYVGTLTERFDAHLMHDVLTRLPKWRLVLVGDCLYAGLGDRPAAELQRLLALTSQVAWHRAVPREQAVALIDRAQVAIIPNRASQSEGQDSMKLYDYAARGRPIVATPVLGAESGDLPPTTIIASGDAEFADAIEHADGTSHGAFVERCRWASEHTWDLRWKTWAPAVFGAGIDQKQ
jgi:glycosyltransferase involved in cell wall biosynthesis